MQRILTCTTLATLALMLAAVVQAQAALTGKWQGETKNGSQVVLDVTATKTALTGTLTVDGQPLTLADGKVSKNMFAFTVTRRDQPEGFTGEIAGDQMTLWMDQRGPQSAAALKRIKK